MPTSLVPHTPQPSRSLSTPMHQRPRPKQLVAVLADAVEMFYNDGEHPNCEQFRICTSSINGSDAYTGHYKYDDVIGMDLLQKYCVEKRVFPQLHHISIKLMVSRFQWALRRSDTPELPWSRSERLKQIAQQRMLAAQEARAAEEAAEAAIAEHGPNGRPAHESRPALVEGTVEE